ncbi:hypothetical protein EYF88_12700 [Paracoccus sediminis]|uniref:Uncharacterized protein n=1 Tax=Paracoccus sediminis TaxID=1214787 RepID=A0A238X7A5_9RHOB|nr:hypothetical protein [Paracoccus sediminis]TBN48963.1 hypothetical protein EYF88_12700 [Paracoccus sediminis]SNR54916.1 hypothetical protein SAMN06265378_108103 [Paracoccus sediminis]
MKPICTGAVAAALLALTTVAAQADCAAEIARLTTGGDASGSMAAESEGISKDGSLAPLEDAPDAAADGDAAAAADAAAATETAAASGMNSAAPTDAEAGAGDEGIAKDGSLAPLEGAEGQQAGVAMSGADAQAQQEGEPTAAEQAAGGTADASTREVHIQAARDALAAGDEDACMKAIEAAGSA